MQSIRRTVAQELEAVNQLIVDQLHSGVPLVENIGHYIVDAGGKRLRPILVLLAGGACGGIGDKHIKLAAVIEFIHTATLLHDDVVDISSLRRGRPTANAEWGNAPSVLVGDFLYTRAFQLLVSIGHMPLMKLIADTTNTIAEGEVLQLTRAGDPDTSEGDYFRVIESKTAVLFAAAAAGGAMLSEADEALQQAMYHYGLELGTAFQLIDDVLDYEGDPATMGKNVGDDLAEGKPTLPLIHAANHSDSADRQLIRDAITHKRTDAIERIVTLARSSGSLHYTRATAERFSRDARERLPIADNSFAEALHRLTELAIDRQA